MRCRPWRPITESVPRRVGGGGPRGPPPPPPSDRVAKGPGGNRPGPVHGSTRVASRLNQWTQSTFASRHPPRDARKRRAARKRALRARTPAPTPPPSARRADEALPHARETAKPPAGGRVSLVSVVAGRFAGDDSLHECRMRTNVIQDCTIWIVNCDTSHYITVHEHAASLRSE
jgi:hypothetical protein